MKKPTKPKPQRMWAVFSSRGYLTECMFQSKKHASDYAFPGDIVALVEVHVVQPKRKRRVGR